MERRGLAPFEWACLGVLLGAALLRLMFLVWPEFIWDTAWYLMLSRSFAENGTFQLRWSDPAAPSYSGYWPPLFPVYLVPFVELAGPTYRAVVLGSIVSAALLVAAVFLTTRDLFGSRTRAFAAAAMTAATPAFYLSDARGMSESLLALMVVLAIWAFLKSLDRPAYLPLAGAFAFLAYLGKASLGLPVVGILVAALVVWRVRTRGWRRVVRSPWDMGLAVAALVALAALALTRTERVGGIGVGVIEPVQRALFGASCARISDALPFTGLPCWLAIFVAKIAFVAAFLVVVSLPLSLRLSRAIRAPRTERTDALWLAVLLPLVAGAVFTTSFFFTENRFFVDFDNIRYLTPAMVPFLWLLLPHWDFDARAVPDERRDRALARTHWRWYAAAVGAMVVVLLLSPMTGTNSLGRFVALLALCAVPLGLAGAAYATRYRIEEQRVGRIESVRVVRDTTPTEARGLVLALAALLVATSWFFSAWYATVGLGLVVALAASTPRARVAGMALILLASAAPAAPTPLPVDDVAALFEGLPEGTVVAMNEPMVYPAAVTPDHVRVMHLELGAPPPPEADLLLTYVDVDDRAFEGYTVVATYHYRIDLTPPVAARIWIERNVLGERIDLPEIEAMRLHARDGSPAADYISRA